MGEVTVEVRPAVLLGRGGAGVVAEVGAEHGGLVLAEVGAGLLVRISASAWVPKRARAKQ